MMIQRPCQLNEQSDIKFAELFEYQQIYSRFL